MPEMRVGYLTWGPFSTSLDELFARFDESGIVSRLQKLATYMRFIQEPVRWTTLSDSHQVPRALGLKSPLGRACLMQIIHSAVIFACSSLAHLMLYICSIMLRAIPKMLCTFRIDCRTSYWFYFTEFRRMTWSFIHCIIM